MSRTTIGHRRRTSWTAYGSGVAVLAALAAYGTFAVASPAARGPGNPAGPGNHAGPAGRGGAQAGGSALQDAFASAAREFGVPQSVLMAVSYRQTRWEAHGGRPSTTGNYNVMGLTQVGPQDLEPPTDADKLAHMNLSGDPDVARHFDAARALRSVPAGVDTSDPRLHTLDAAAALIGRPAEALRTDRRQSVRGAAALLARYEKEAYGSLPADAGRWYAAVARYSQSAEAAAADQFARRVFASIRTGESLVTDDGQQVALRPEPSVQPVQPTQPVQPGQPGAGPSGTGAAPVADCPATLTCDFVPAAFKQLGAADDFGDYDPANRVPGPPAAGREDIRYIVVHDMEGTFAGTVSEFQNHPQGYASAHYLIGCDGRVTQMVRTKDEAWHSANKTVNMHSIGVEHEGWAMKAGTWYTEPEYDSSAALVTYLAGRFGVPLDRQHVIGHDEVPGVLDAKVAAQHWDPGPFWDWNHYMTLLGAAGAGQGGSGAPKTGQLVRIVPPFSTANQPTLTSGGKAFAAHPADFVYLYTSPAATAAKATDPYLGTALWSDGSNWADKAVAGSEYVVADTSGSDWTAIWYGGRKLWFANPGGRWTAPVGAGQSVITPQGAAAIPVYGRAYPEQAAYAPVHVPVQSANDTALTKYTLPAGQSYAPAGPLAVGDYYYAGTYAGTATGDRTLVQGSRTFYPIQYNHRIAWVRASDVRLTASAG